jgi:hypothetical protein
MGSGVIWIGLASAFYRAENRGLAPWSLFSRSGKSEPDHRFVGYSVQNNNIRSNLPEIKVTRNW